MAAATLEPLTFPSGKWNPINPSDVKRGDWVIVRKGQLYRQIRARTGQSQVRPEVRVLRQATPATSANSANAGPVKTIPISAEVLNLARQAAAAVTEVMRMPGGREALESQYAILDLATAKARRLLPEHAIQVTRQDRANANKAMQRLRQDRKDRQRAGIENVNLAAYDAVIQDLEAVFRQLPVPKIEPTLQPTANPLPVARSAS